MDLAVYKQYKPDLDIFKTNIDVWVIKSRKISFERICLEISFTEKIPMQSIIVDIEEYLGLFQYTDRMSMHRDSHFKDEMVLYW